MPFRIPTRTQIGSGVLSHLSAIAVGYAPGTALVITDPGLSETDLPKRVCDLLTAGGLRPWVLVDVAPNPRVADVDRMAQVARVEKPSLVVALGGGSVLDAAKGVALLITNPGSCRDYEGRNRFREPAAPLVAIPTTCGTGSEVTWVAVLSDQEERRKISVKGDGMFPHWALVDPDVLVTLPATLVAATGMDAATHAIEAFIGRAANPASDELAAAALRHLAGSLERAVADIAGDRSAREAVMLGSTLAGMAFGNADVGGVHCLSEAIGGRHDLPHGLLNAILLAPVLRYHGQHASGRLERLSEVSGVPDIVEYVEAMGRAVGIPDFSRLGVPGSDFDAIAEEAEANGSNGSNPRPMTKRDYLLILEGLS